MADEPSVPDPQEGTPEAPSADPQQGTPAPQETVDWEQRYKDLQSEWTPQQQELAQYRQFVEGLQAGDPEVTQAVLDQLGLEYAAQDQGEEFDPITSLSQQVQELQQLQASSQEQQQIQQLQAQEYEFMNQALSAFEGELGRELTEDELHFVVPHALNNRQEDGFPDIQGALQRWSNLEQARQEQWAQTKHTSTPASGREGVEAPDLDASHSERVAAMVAQHEANQALT